MERSTLLKGEEIKIKGLLIDRTFFFHENLKKKQIVNSAFEQNRKELKREMIKDFSKELFESKIIMNNSIEFSEANRRESQMIVLRSPQNNEMPIENSIFMSGINKTGSLIQNKRMTLTRNLLKSNTIEFQHFSDLYSDLQKNVKLYDVLQVFQ